MTRERLSVLVFHSTQGSDNPLFHQGTMCKQNGSASNAAATANGATRAADVHQSPPSQQASVAHSRKICNANPPWHTVAFIVLLLAHFTAKLPDCLSSMHDPVANRETFLHVNFPRLLTIRQVALVRLFLGSVMILDTLYAFFYGKWEQDTEYYYPHSRLKAVRGIHFRGYMYTGSIKSGLLTLSSFTMWSWTLEGITFVLLGGISLYLAADTTDTSAEVPAWIYRVALIGWNICAPTSLLVSAIVKYVLWPMALEQGGNNSNVLKHPGALLEHNWNVLSCLVEVALLGGLPIRYQDYIWSPLFGLVYVLHAYAVRQDWAPSEHGAQFQYPFLDTTLGWRTTACLLALLGVLTLSFGIFCGLDHFITETLDERDLKSHLAAVLVIGAFVCRFRD